MKHVLVIAAAAAAIVTGICHGAEPKYDFEEIMTKGHKGKESLLAKVLAKAASPEEVAKLVEYHEALAQQAPPKGDAESWKQKTGALLQASRAAKENASDENLAKLKETSNCKACHSIHQPE
ncbi:MAG: hypothetical protein IT577_09165 [Verrucomicrobiae bacterium]|nr:hypothetical protein [Verrucomicrobiae bacterium]